MIYVGLLRGINVGGKNKIKMAELRSLCESLGWNSVDTYIQSGNIIFESERDQQTLETHLKQELEQRLSLQIPVMIIPDKDWYTAIAQQPFKNQPIEHLHLTWLKSIPVPSIVENFKTLENGDDAARVAENRVYLKINRPYHKTKLSNQFFERTFKMQATTRNWKTILKIQEMLLKHT